MRPEAFKNHPMPFGVDVVSLPVFIKNPLWKQELSGFKARVEGCSTAPAQKATHALFDEFERQPLGSQGAGAANCEPMAFWEPLEGVKARLTPGQCAPLVRECDQDSEGSHDSGASLVVES